MSNSQPLNPMIKAILVLLLLIIGIFFIGNNFANAQHGQTSPVLNEYFRMVFAGDISSAQKLFEDNPDDHGAMMIKDRFYDRFVAKTSHLDLTAIESEKVQEIINLYENYWRDALLNLAPLNHLDEQLKSRLNQMMMKEGFESAFNGGDDEDEEDLLFENLVAFIESQGYFALAGTSPPLLELAVWTEKDIYTQEIELTDGVYNVDISKLDGFVSSGWANFTTFGMTSMGGWATKEGLNCVCANYDTSSERFELSFLKHEGRHFADFGIYPELEAPDLEYRAKLTELVYSKNAIYKLTEHFTNGAMKIDHAPHALANWYVVDGLARHLLNGQTPNDADAWKDMPEGDIRRVAQLLLTESDHRLTAAGAEVATGFILP